MTAPQVGVVGMKALLRDLNRLGSDTGPLAKQLRQAGIKAATPVAEAARSHLPQDTGRLAGDVRITANKAGATVKVGRSSLRYAGWVEFGGHRRAPHPSTRDYQPRGRYIFPYAVSLAGPVAQIYAVEVQKALDGFAWTNPSTSGAHD
jgi:hypothetical protein